jgi:hypothetical protein
MKIRNLLLVFIVAFGLVYCGSENNVTEYIESGNVDEIKKTFGQGSRPDGHCR